MNRCSKFSEQMREWGSCPEDARPQPGAMASGGTEEKGAWLCRWVSWAPGTWGLLSSWRLGEQGSDESQSQEGQSEEGQRA